MFLRLGPGHPAPAELPDVAEAAPLGDGGGLLAADARHAGEHQRGPVSHRHVEQGLELLWSHGQSCLESNICVVRLEEHFTRAPHLQVSQGNIDGTGYGAVVEQLLGVPDVHHHGGLVLEDVEQLVVADILHLAAVAPC